MFPDFSFVLEESGYDAEQRDPRGTSFKNISKSYGIDFKFPIFLQMFVFCSSINHAVVYARKYIFSLKLFCENRCFAKT